MSGRPRSTPAGLVAVLAALGAPVPARLRRNAKGRLLPFAALLCLVAAGLGRVLFWRGRRVLRHLLHLDDQLIARKGPDWEATLGFTPRAWEDPADEDPTL